MSARHLIAALVLAVLYAIVTVRWERRCLGHLAAARELLDDAREVVANAWTVTDEMVDRLAKSRYERFDSHYSMPNGLTWDEYIADDPSGARFYHDEAEQDLTVALTREPS